MKSSRYNSNTSLSPASLKISSQSDEHYLSKTGRQALRVAGATNNVYESLKWDIDNNFYISGIAKNLDKASVIRITISFLRMCKFAENGLTDWTVPIDKDHKKVETISTISLRKQIALNTLRVSFYNSSAHFSDNYKKFNRKYFSFEILT